MLGDFKEYSILDKLHSYKGTQKMAEGQNQNNMSMKIQRGEENFQKLIYYQKDIIPKQMMAVHKILESTQYKQWNSLNTKKFQNETKNYHALEQIKQKIFKLFSQYPQQQKEFLCDLILNKQPIQKIEYELPANHYENILRIFKSHQYEKIEKDVKVAKKDVYLAQCKTQLTHLFAPINFEAQTFIQNLIEQKNLRKAQALFKNMQTRQGQNFIEIMKSQRWKNILDRYQNINRTEYPSNQQIVRFETKMKNRKSQERKQRAFEKYENLKERYNASLKSLNILKLIQKQRDPKEKTELKQMNNQNLSQHLINELKIKYSKIFGYQSYEQFLKEDNWKTFISFNLPEISNALPLESIQRQLQEMQAGSELIENLNKDIKHITGLSIKKQRLLEFIKDSLNKSGWFGWLGQKEIIASDIQCSQDFAGNLCQAFIMEKSKYFTNEQSYNEQQDMTNVKDIFLFVIIDNIQFFI